MGVTLLSDRGEAPALAWLVRARGSILKLNGEVGLHVVSLPSLPPSRTRVWPLQMMLVRER